jgi:signal transduction histidine kinase/CheY-like chemotaxis protein
VRDAVRLLGTQHSVRVGPLRWLRAGQPVRWYEASLTRYRAGGAPRVLIVAREVTERIQLEAQLRQSQKMQAVGQLGSGMAHDFNNLLMVISGYAEVLASRAGGNPELISAAEEIQRATDQGAALTRRLVGLARPSVLARRTVDLSAAVREAEQMLRVLLGEGVSLLLELAPGPLPVRADPGEIEQLLVNLVTNARDALRATGAVRIATSARGDRATIVVHDNGTGIAPALRERIFEPFFTTKETGQGSGLGLYVVYNIVSALGGEIEVHSDVGAGTRITLLLPLVREAAPLAAQPRRAARAVGGHECILVVEDRPELRTLLRESLESVGYEVVVAADGLEALALGVHDRVDLVVSDVVMPRLGGIALGAALREKRPELRALFVSGQSAELRELGPGDRLLRKPFLIEDLRRQVRATLDGQ